MNDNQDKKQKAKEKYHNGGGKERLKEYYKANKEVIKEKAKIRYQNLSEEQKELKRQYSNTFSSPHPQPQPPSLKHYFSKNN